MTKQFKVASVSENTNSFGLTGMILIAADGEAWSVGANDLNKRAKGDAVDVPVAPRTGLLSFASLGYEIPNRLPKCPPKAVKEVFDYGGITA